MKDSLVRSWFWPPTTKAKQRVVVACLLHDLRQPTRRLNDAEWVWIFEEVYIQLHNRSPISRGVPTCTPIDPIVAQAIKDEYFRDPSQGMHVIGAHFNVPAGRVSEVIRGARW